MQSARRMMVPVMQEGAQRTLSTFRRAQIWERYARDEDMARERAQRLPGCGMGRTSARKRTLAGSSLQEDVRVRALQHLRLLRHLRNWEHYARDEDTARE